MANKKLILGGVIVVAAVCAFIALRGPMYGNKDTAGTIGAANRYQSQQISDQDVTLDSPQMASFLQSDAFRRLASDQKFRQAAKHKSFSRIVSSDLRAVSAKHDLGRVLGNASVKNILNDPSYETGVKTGVLPRTMQKAPRLFTAQSSPKLAQLLKTPGLEQLAATEGFRSLAEQYNTRIEEIRTTSDAARTVEALRTIDALRGMDEARRTEALRKMDDGLRTEALRTMDDGFRTEALRSMDAALRTEALRNMDAALRTEALRSMDEARRTDALRTMDEALRTEALRSLEAVRQIDALRSMDEARRTEALRKMDDALRTEALRSMDDGFRTEALRSMDDGFRTEALRKMDDALRIEALRNMDEALRTEALRNMDGALRTEALRTMEEARTAEALRTEDARIITDQFALSEFNRMLGDHAAVKTTDAIRALEGNKFFAEALAGGFMELFASREVAAYSMEGLRKIIDSQAFTDALRIEGFTQFTEALNGQNLEAAREIAGDAEMMRVLSNESYREAALHAELGAVATTGLEAAIQKTGD